MDLSGIKAIAILDWPKAIHDGGGKAVFVVEPDTTDEQVNCLAQIYTGQLGGNPWAILGGTFEVAGLVKTPIRLGGSGLALTLTAYGVGEGRGDTFKNPVTGNHTKPRSCCPTGSSGKRRLRRRKLHRQSRSPRPHLQRHQLIYYEFDWDHDK